MSDQEIMTVEEVAKLLRVSERTVYEWAQKGIIPSGKLGSVWRFRRAEIQRWVEQQLSPAAKPKLITNLNLTKVLPVERIVILTVQTKREALEAVIDTLARAPEVTSREELAAGIFQREELMSTGIGMGVAVPHVRLPSIREVVMAAARCQQPLSDYESLDGWPVRLIFMIAAGRDQHAQHLKLLSAISSQLKKKELRQKLIDAPDPAAFQKILLEAEG